MAQTQILLKRGASADFAGITLAAGEPAFLTDTGKLYVGDGTTNILINEDLGDAAYKDTGTDEGDVVVIQPGGKLDPSIIPSATITDVYVVADKAARLALTEAGVGDVAVQTDTQRSYILEAVPASVEGNWVELVAAGYVTSVAGKSGDVTLAMADITDSATILAAKADLASPTFTGTPKAPTPLASDNSTRIATTAYVQALIGDIPGSPVISVNGKTGAVVLTGEDIDITGYVMPTEGGALAATDSVNEALGKLEREACVVDGGNF